MKKIVKIELPQKIKKLNGRSAKKLQDAIERLGDTIKKES
jgi:hypothetical protein